MRYELGELTSSGPQARLSIATTLTRLLYRFAYRAARVWWFIRRPETFGALVALWNGGRILLVQASYRRCYTLPGGFMKPGESAREAACRELAEELQLFIPPATLKLGWHGSRGFERRKDTVTIWDIQLDAPPAIRFDGREVIWAGWRTPAEARSLELLPHVRDYLAGR
jgi:8-oxo-dGTP diphosphatase